jgi:hypothetical protein
MFAGLPAGYYMIFPVPVENVVAPAGKLGYNLNTVLLITQPGRHR